jgi:hypothetical protein
MKKLFHIAPVLISLSLFSCQSIPEDPKKPANFDEIRQLDCNTPLQETEVNLAKEFFYSEWLDTFGDPDLIVAYNLDRVCVEFESEKWLVKDGFSLDGAPFPEEGRMVIGQAMSRSHVRVFLKSPNTSISDTSFVHELVHVSLWALFSDPDADHVGNKHKGWTKKHTDLIKRVNIFMKLLGL